MIDRVVLHVGTPKTGSTAIQESLAEAHDALLAQGVLYPKSCRVGAAHAPLSGVSPDWAAPVIEQGDDRGLVEEAQAERASTIVVSSETLTFWDGRRAVRWAEGLREALAPRRMQIVAYVRPQWEYIESLYGQLVKKGWTWLPFDAYLDRSLGDPRFDYRAVFTPWRAAFGRALRVRPYARAPLGGRDVVADFWRLLDLGSPPVRTADSNASTGIRTTEMLRALRELMAEYGLDGLLPSADERATDPGHPGSLAELKRAAGALRRAQRWIEDALPEEAPATRLTGETVERIARHFASSNEEFARDFLYEDHRHVFSPRGGLAPPASRWCLAEASERERRVFAGVVAMTLGALSVEDASDRRRSPAPPARSRRP